MPLILHTNTEAEWLALRATDITSTEAAALFGLSPYSTPFELWHQKKAGTIVEIDENERMLWGTRLQDTIARGLGEDYGVKVRRLNAYMRHDKVARMGSSFDFEIVGLLPDWTGKDDILRRLYTEHGVGILEIKNVDRSVWANQWQDGEPPMHIQTQAQHQLEVSDRGWVAIGALIGGNKIELVVQVRDREIGAMITTKVREFWQAVEAGQAPDPDFKADAGFIAKLYGYAEPGRIMDASGNARITDLAAAYIEAGKRERLAKDDKDAAKAELLTLIGAAEKVVAPGFSISAGMVAPAHVEYDRDGYRAFKITPRKQKEK